MARILIVDDELSMRHVLTSNLRQDQHQIWEAGGVKEACRALLVNTFDVVFADQKMSDGEGLAVLAVAHETDAAISMVLLMARATIELAVESMRQGAFGFLTKPFRPDVVRATARRAAEHTQLLRENVLLKHAMVRLGGPLKFMDRVLRCTRYGTKSRASRPRTPRCSSPAKQGPEKSWWRGLSIGIVCVPANLSYR